MSGARQNTSQEAVINLSKKLDSMIDSSVEQSRLSVKLLGSIEVKQFDIADELKKQTSALDSMVGSFSKWQEKQFNVLSSIDKKSGLGSLGSPASIILPDTGKLTEFFKVMLTSGAKALVAIFTTLGIVGKMGDDVKKGAQSVAESMAILLSVGDMISFKTAMKSIVYQGLLAKSDISSLIKTLMNVSLAGLLFDERIIKTAEYVRDAVGILLSAGQGISMGSAIRSISFYRLVAASNLQELMDVLHSSFSLKAFLGFGGNLTDNATDLSSAVNILLRAGEGISMGSATRSIAFYKLVAASKLKDLMDVLMTSFGLFGGMFAGMKMRKRARQIRESVAILCGGTSDVWNKLHGIDDSKFTMENAIKSVLVYGLIGKGVGILLSSLMQSFGFLGLGGTKKIIQRAINLRKAVVILADLPKELDRDKLIKATLSYLLLGLGIKLLVKPIIWAGLLFPLVWIGTRVIAGATRRILKPLNEITSSGKQILAATVFLVAIGSFITGLLFLTFIAAIGSPIILIGTLVIYGMLDSIIKINNKLKDGGVDTAAVERITLLATVIGLLITAAASIIGFVRTQSVGSVIKNIIIFVVTTLIIVKLTIMTSKMLAKSLTKDKIEMFNILASSINILTSAISVILLSQFAKGGIRSALTVILFTVAMAIMTYASVKAVKEMTDSKITLLQVIALGMMMAILVSSVVAIVLVARQLKLMDVITVVGFMLISFIIAFGVKQITKYLSEDYKKTLLGVSALLIFAIGMLAVGIAIMMFDSIVSISAAIFVFLVIGAFSFLVHQLGKNAADNLQGAAVLAVIGVAIVIFSYGLLIFKASGFGLLDAFVLILTVGGLGLVAYLIGENFSDVAMGSLGIALIGISLFVITYVLDYFKSIKVGWEDIAKLGATVGMLGIEFYLIGKKWEEVAKGAGVVAGFGVALWVLGHGMKTWMKADVSWKQVGILGATIGMLGIELYEVGKKWEEVGKGALAIAGLGAALWVVGHGMKSWMKAGASWKQVGILGATIAMLALEFGLAGGEAAFIGFGALAIAGLGAALWVVGHGMTVWVKAKAKWSDVKILGAAIAMLGFEFAAAGGGSVLIGFGAAAMAGLGAALFIIAKGMKIFASSNITYKDVKILKSAISGLGNVFGDLGWKRGSIIDGAIAMKWVGKSLYSVTGALKRFKQSRFDLKDAMELKESIFTLVSAISLLGNEKALSTIGVTPESLKKGAEGIRGMSHVFKKLLKFMKEWSEFKNQGKILWSIRHFIEGISSIFDHKQNKAIHNSSKHLSNFAFNLEKMANAADPLTKLAKNMDSIQNSMRLFKNHLNGLDLKKLTLTDSMMKSIAALSKNPEAIAKLISQSINKSYDELIKALKELSKSVKPTGETPIAENKSNIEKPISPKIEIEKPGKPTKQLPLPIKDVSLEKGVQKVYIVNAPPGWI